MLRQVQQFLWICLAAWPLAACQSNTAFDVKQTRFMLGTLVEFTIYTTDENLANQAIIDAALVMADVERRFTIYGEGSNTVKLLNAAPVGEHVVLDPQVDQLLQQSLQIWADTDHNFDPSLGQLTKAWGFSDSYAAPLVLSAEHVAEKRAKTGGQYLQRVATNTWRKSKPDIWLDFGGIAKGYAIDSGIAALQAAGIQHAIINAGGDLRVLGDHGGQAWKIAVRNPRADTPLGWLEIHADASIVTSGDYERFFWADHQRYHHIIDPNTGFPSAASVSVTLLAANATLADALSTAMFIYGPKPGLHWLQSHSDVEALWVDTQQNIHMSKGFKPIFHSL